MNNDIKNSKKIIIAGGGTGGHIFPAIAIANALKAIDSSIEILFVGAKGKMEMEKIPQAGYSIKGLDITGFNRSSMLKNISLPFKIIKSFYQVKNIFKEFLPDAVIGVGGYSTFPVLKYAEKKGIPTFIHESNSFAGKSNILLGKNATKIFVASEGMENFFPANKIMITGNPVRKIISESTVTRNEGIKFFGLDENKKTILAVGGSLGARSINEVIMEHLIDIKALNIQLIWQTGKTNSARYIHHGKLAPRNVWVGEFIQDMDKALAAADVVVSRAGAMSVAELCVAKKPVVFVPYPFAAEDHQTVNAKKLVDKNAAEMISNDEAKIKLFGAVTDLLMNEERCKTLSENIGKLAVTNANEIIAKEILASLNPSKGGTY
ncbi:undecaprenyldiphospho-muramoylpentapeptide beta-N-acetylglucosaminyltransferase [Arachidicoccus ginsenosidimutans]|uniref:undecaprenyldiphospho-muramoylpentapeptide beta-N-acetylglucosaminyltransferase n=1 Tax=Arachidicoccus sp. BS20 TaxID=1850526 RepID=UPI0007F0C608|nr:undecaprenyldiphospho-muramoylpentapeptide beta-N-acetylglucosaminyltransferase [Arachidicoccus sp. BS20]ANI90336.1 undecaprenyldiphospho-muramoylpentapeptide beta-N-acetylglucosaminyltransferase [Arachidicoccus sp. BS20]